jgi:hypothetical protein
MRRCAYRNPQHEAIHQPLPVLNVTIEHVGPATRCTIDGM